MNVFSEQGWLDVFDTVTGANLLYRIHLYKNNHVPAFTDTILDFTEADFSGYGSSILLAWGAAVINSGVQALIATPPVSWTRSSGPTSNTVYGVYVTNVAGDLMYAERFPAPISMTSNGDTISYEPLCTLINQ